MKVDTTAETCCIQLVRIHKHQRSTAIRKLVQKGCCEYGCLDIPDIFSRNWVHAALECVSVSKIGLTPHLYQVKFLVIMVLLVFTDFSVFFYIKHSKSLLGQFRTRNVNASRRSKVFCHLNSSVICIFFNVKIPL